MTAIRKLLCGLVLLLPCAGNAHRQHSYDRVPLPEKVFKALEAGRPQTVVVYGTSVTVGGQWAVELEAYFESLYPGKVRFINSAGGGQQSIWGVNNLQERVIDKNPDLVFIEFAINDAATKHGISIEDSRNNLDTMVKALEKHNPDVQIVLQTMNPAWDSPKSAPKKYAEARPHLEDYYAVYSSYARTNNLPLVDQYPIWKKIMDEEPERYQAMVPDGIHPDNGPSRDIAWPNVKEILDRARAFAGGEVTVHIWPEGLMPGSHADEPESLRSPERTDAIRVTNVSDPTLTLYRTGKTGKPAPVMVICPGGGYSYCTVDKEGAEIAAWLNSIGIHALVLNYRTPDNRNGALQDIQRSISMARANAGAWNIDPDKVGVIGFSAGGHLSVMASQHFGTPSYSPIDNTDRMSCRPDFAVLVYPAYLERDGRIAEDQHLEADIPPTLIVHSKDDGRFIAGSRLYASALKEKGISHEFLLYETGGHGYGLRSEGEARAWPAEAEKWLKKIGMKQH